MTTTGRLRTALCASLTVAALGALAAAPAPAAKNFDRGERCTGARATPSQIAPGAYVQAVLCLLNRERDDEDLKPLRSNASLTVAAAAHSAAMCDHSFFEHEGSDGSTPTTRIRATGYLKNARRWTIGENIAWGESWRGSPAAIVGAWMDSQGHRENILNGRFREIGIGISAGSPLRSGQPNTTTITTDFGGVERAGRGR